MKRRSFIKNITGSAAVLVLPSWAPNESATFAYMQMSGLKDTPCVFGGLVLENTQQHIEDLSAFRTSTNYHKNISYRSRDRYKLALCQAWIDHFFASGDMRLVGYVHDWDGTDLDGSWLDAALIMQRETASPDARMNVISEPFRDDYNHFQWAQTFKNTLPEVGFTTLHSWDSDLLQLADLLTGMTFSIVNNDLATNATKVELINYFKQQLDDPTMVSSINQYRGLRLVCLINKKG